MQRPYERCTFISAIQPVMYGLVSTVEAYSEQILKAGAFSNLRVQCSLADSSVHPFCHDSTIYKKSTRLVYFLN